MRNRSPPPPVTSPSSAAAAPARPPRARDALPLSPPPPRAYYLLLLLPPAPAIRTTYLLTYLPKEAARALSEVSSLSILPFSARQAPFEYPSGTAEGKTAAGALKGGAAERTQSPRSLARTRCAPPRLEHVPACPAAVALCCSRTRFQLPYLASAEPAPAREVAVAGLTDPVLHSLERARRRCDGEGHVGCACSRP